MVRPTPVRVAKTELKAIAAWTEKYLRKRA